MVENRMTDVLIVGAGMSGLMAARTLTERGLRVTLLDKGHGVGGRMATRRIGEGLADHGAQFFTVRSPEFQQFVDAWIADGLVYEWSRGWNDGSLALVRDGHPRYAVRGGFNGLAKHLAQGLDARSEITVTAVRREGDGWRVTDSEGRGYDARGVVLTAPVPQSLALLDAGDTKLHADDRVALDRIEYVPCLTGLFWVDDHSGLPAPGGVQRPEANISWVADNQRKGISPKAVVITAQASARYSRQLWEREDADILRAFRVDLLPFLRDGGVIHEMQLKRWRYSKPTVLYPDVFLLARDLPALAFAGDAFREARVEGAALSGLGVGQALLQV